jgi:hypothetical protein
MGCEKLWDVGIRGISNSHTLSLFKGDERGQRAQRVGIIRKGEKTFV